MRKKVVCLITVLCFVNFNLGSPIYIITRRIKGVNPYSEKILAKIFSLSQSKDTRIRISSATALVKLGKEIEGYKILEEFTKVAEPEIILATARAYLDLEKVDPLNKIRGLQLLDKIELTKITQPRLGLEIAREYFRQGLFSDAERVILYLEKNISNAPEAEEIAKEIKELRADIARRKIILALLEQTKESDRLGNPITSQQRLKALRQLLEIEMSLEELSLLKDVFLDFSQSKDLNIRIGLVEVMREGLIILPWHFQILQNLILQTTFPVAEAGLETARVMGFNYLENIMRIQHELVSLKHAQDIFLQYHLCKELGNLQVREGMVNTLIKAWGIHQGEILRRKIIEALGYWGINSSEAKEFLGRIIREDKDLGEIAQEALKDLQKKENVLKNEFRYIEENLRKGNITSPHVSIFTLLGGFWTVYGFTEARDILLAMDSSPLFYPYIEEVLFALRFRPDETVFGRLNAHLRNSYSILEQFKQFMSLNTLIEPWWIENNPKGKFVLRDFLERLSQERVLDYLKLKMALLTANVLLLYGNPEEKKEIAWLTLGLLDKFPPSPDEETIKLYLQIIWVIGERLR
ncbi:MAG: hypothetical protein NC834_01480 [Candidatus Omnitrophica bacterium]|nr:hypothetical protein [Candidatus Omnitrophota bacterium]